MKRTDALDLEREMAELAADMKRVSQYGVYTGRLTTPQDAAYFRRCSRVFPGQPYARLVFTRDGGMHTSGWWKNPDYEQCLHLSLSFFDTEGGFAETESRIPFAPPGGHVTPLGRLPHQHQLAERWVDLFFGDWKRLIWIEPPYSREGKVHDVWHYRVFTDPTYRVPLLPRGEVYTREFTEAGWKSWSDVHGERVESAHE